MSLKVSELCLGYELPSLKHLFHPLLFKLCSIDSIVGHLSEHTFSRRSPCSVGWSPLVILMVGLRKCLVCRIWFFESLLELGCEAKFRDGRLHRSLLGLCQVQESFWDTEDSSR